MKIQPGIDIVDLALYLKSYKTLVIADLHIGYEEALNKQGILMPRFQYKELSKRLLTIIDKTRPETIVINGDFKHEFGEISETEWRQALRVFDLLAKHSDIIIIKGNHDTILGPIADKRKIKVLDHYTIVDIYITHGNTIPKDMHFKKAKTIIIGHEHPAVSIREHARSETFKCFLVGKWKQKTLIVMPSLNLITEGTDILHQKLLSPFLTDVSKFDVYVAADKTYPFGKVHMLMP
ncbi:MAG: metallophosphoesterase [Candidatus Woesearchaeota archaeon]